MTEPTSLRDVPPAAVQQAMQERTIVLIDVREPHEFVAERIAGALLFPLSSFDPGALPSPDGATIVFHCWSGKRSALAVARCLEQGVGHFAHMAGGIQAWKAADLPTIG